MTETNPVERPKTPWHLWLVGGLATLWNAVGAVDFTATVTRFEPYMSNVAQAMRDYLYALPIWMFLPWGVGVWGGFVGSILLLLRRKLAAPVLGVSLAGAAGVFAIGMVQPAPEGASDPVFAGFIVAIAVLVFTYAIWVSRRGILR